MIHGQPFTLQLLGYPEIPIPRELADKLFNTVLNVSYPFLFPKSLFFGYIVIAALGKFYCFAPPLDASTSGKVIGYIGGLGACRD